MTNAIEILAGKPEAKIWFKSQIWERACQETNWQLGGLMNLTLVALILVWNIFDIAWHDGPFHRWDCCSRLAVFSCVRKLAKSDYLLRHVFPSVRPSVRMEKLGSHEKDFHEIWYLNIFRKSDETVRASLKSDKNSGYFTWRPINSLYHHFNY